jgi:hypothetical protein
MGVDALPPELQVDIEEWIAATLFDYQRQQTANDEDNGCDDHTLTDEDCGDLGRTILAAVLEKLPTDQLVAQEREACARIAEGFEQTRDWVQGSLYENIRREVAAAIRARGPLEVAGNIEITVEGGCVTGVEGLPPGFTYTVRDFDSNEGIGGLV